MSLEDELPYVVKQDGRIVAGFRNTTQALSYIRGYNASVGLEIKMQQSDCSWIGINELGVWVVTGSKWHQPTFNVEG